MVSVQFGKRLIGIQKLGIWMNMYFNILISWNGMTDALSDLQIMNYLVQSNHGKIGEPWKELAFLYQKILNGKLNPFLTNQKYCTLEGIIWRYLVNQTSKKYSPTASSVAGQPLPRQINISGTSQTLQKLGAGCLSIQQKLLWSWLKQIQKNTCHHC